MEECDVIINPRDPFKSAQLMTMQAKPFSVKHGNLNDMFIMVSTFFYGTIGNQVRRSLAEQMTCMPISRLRVRN